MHFFCVLLSVTVSVKPSFCFGYQPFQSITSCNTIPLFWCLSSIAWETVPQSNLHTLEMFYGWLSLQCKHTLRWPFDQMWPSLMDLLIEALTIQLLDRRTIQRGLEEPLLGLYFCHLFYQQARQMRFDGFLLCQEPRNQIDATSSCIKYKFCNNFIQKPK